MSRIEESLYRVNGLELNESNFDKSTSITSKIGNMIEKYLPGYDVIYSDNAIKVSNGVNTETFIIKAKQITKYTLASPIYGDDFTNVKEIYEPKEFVDVCVGKIVEYLKD
jgi:hypothetical protein